jgi:IS605 OrfB family transposase
VEYSQQFDDPVIILEDLKNIRDSIDYGTEMNRRLHNWAFRDLQKKIEYKAKEAGIPVVYVNPENTSAKCHNCLHKGAKDSGRFVCQNKRCPVSEYDRDLNAAVNIAQRGAYRLCESGRLGKARHNDIQADGAPLTVLQPRTPTTPTKTVGAGEVAG